MKPIKIFPIIMLLCAITFQGTACEKQNIGREEIFENVSDEEYADSAETVPPSRLEVGQSLIAENQTEASGGYLHADMEITWLDFGPGIDGFSFMPPVLAASEGVFTVHLVMVDDSSDKQEIAIAIDSQGTIVAGTGYTNIGSFYNGLARVTRVVPGGINGTDIVLQGFIDRNGNEAIPLTEELFDDFHEDLALYGIYPSEIAMGIGFIDTNGRPTIDVSPHIAGNFHEDRAWVSDAKTGLAGYINRQGEEVIPMIYEMASDFHEGLAYVVKDGTGRYIDQNGADVIVFASNNVNLEFPSESEYLPIVNADFHNGLAYCNGGYLNKSGEYLIPEGTYATGSPFVEEKATFAVLRDEKATVLIDRSGNMLTKPGQYECLGDSVKDGLIRVFSRESPDRIGAVNEDGTEIIPLDFVCITEFTNGYALVIPDVETERPIMGILKIPK
jgi:hypothetical protein